METLPPLSEFLAMTFNTPPPLDPGVGPQSATPATHHAYGTDFSEPLNSHIPVEHTPTVASAALLNRSTNTSSPVTQQCWISGTTMASSPHQYEVQTTNRKPHIACSISGPLPSQHVEQKKPRIQSFKGYRWRRPYRGRPGSWSNRVCRYSKCGRTETIQGRSNLEDGKAYTRRGSVYIKIPQEKHA
ncbi:uncharacterized protein BKA55DRAFT_720223 [Fusarium redolens]|uniref:Uncharacterized protein n=1 Tax=Fusarium redolens TaxID=48865 RepID=A0A9P9FX41_FUSRE|nr:uncharacterized protein BKA55DRAFT_720223 [Fusarium redolens]KAH7208444.1 hypothetical protein BKA55DRAFT_720223 [Fusarium redolens]